MPADALTNAEALELAYPTPGRHNGGNMGLKPAHGAAGSR
jgi:hypothetical protein